MNKTRRFLLLLGVLSLILMLPLGAQAFKVDAERSFVIEEGQKIEKNLYLIAKEEIDIRGELDGDLICLASSLRISGKVSGDVICAVKKVDMRGDVGGDLRVAAGENVSISGQVEKNANVLAPKMALPRLASIGDSLLVFSEKANINGSVGRNVEGVVSQANIAGHIGEDINLDIEGKTDDMPLSINDQAYIGGSINYNSFDKRISISEEAYINGRVNHQFKVVEKKSKNPFGFGWTYSLITSLLVGLLLVGLWKERCQEIMAIMSKRVKSSFKWGLLFFFLIPIACLILFITLIGIPLSILLFIAWVIFLFVARVLAGVWVGDKILKKISFQADNLLLAMALGVLLVKIAFAIPVVGIFLQIITLVWSIGAIWLSFRRKKVSVKRKGSSKSTKTKKVRKHKKK